MELAVADAPSSVCANGGCVTEEEPPGIAGIVDNISTAGANVIRLYPDLDLNNLYQFRKSLIDIYAIKKINIASIQWIMI